MGVMWTGSLNFVPRASLLVGGAPSPPPHPLHEREKSPGNEVGVACGLFLNKMADDTLSSEDEAAFRFW